MLEISSLNNKLSMVKKIDENYSFDVRSLALMIEDRLNWKKIRPTLFHWLFWSYYCARNFVGLSEVESTNVSCLRTSRWNSHESIKQFKGELAPSHSDCYFVSYSYFTNWPWQLTPRSWEQRHEIENVQCTTFYLTKPRDFSFNFANIIICEEPKYTFSLTSSHFTDDF